MKNKYVMANFKMNKNDKEVEEYLNAFKPLAKDKEVKIVLGVPFTSLKTAVEMTRDTDIMIASQNMSEHEKGAFTGEVSADMLTGVGTDAVIIGHSERRSLYNESNETVNKKILRALKSGLFCVFCIGETLYERKNQLTESVLQKQLSEGLKSIYANELKNIVIAYEPVWAIGTGVVPTNKQIVDAMASIRKTLTGIYNAEIAEATIIQYGGSVNEKNAAEIASLKGVDGALVGGAGLDPNKFNAIIDGFLAAK